MAEETANQAETAIPAEDQIEQDILDPQVRIAQALEAVKPEPEVDPDKPVEDPDAKPEDGDPDAEAKAKAEAEAKVKADAEADPDKPKEEDLPERTYQASIKAIKADRESRVALKAAEKTVAELTAKLAGQTEGMSDLAETQAFIEKFKAGPYQFLESMGLSLEAWTEYSANGGKAGPMAQIQELQAKIKTMEAAKDAPVEAPAAEEPTQENIDAAMVTYTDTIRDEMMKSEYGHIARRGTVVDVIEYAKQHLKETRAAGSPEVLTAEIAVKAYNDFLKEKFPDLEIEEPVKKEESAKKAAPAAKPEKKEPEAPASLDGNPGSRAPVIEGDPLDPQVRIANAVAAFGATKGA